MDLEADRARNEADVKKDQLLSRTNGIDAVLKANHLDAILTPASSAADLSARAGYPLIVVPFAMVPNGRRAARSGRTRILRASIPNQRRMESASPGPHAASRACSESLMHLSRPPKTVCRRLSFRENWRWVKGVAERGQNSLPARRSALPRSELRAN